MKRIVLHGHLSVVQSLVLLLKLSNRFLFLIDSGTNVRTFWREQRHTLTTKVYYVVFALFKRRYISDVLRSDEMFFFSVYILIVSISIFFIKAYILIFHL